MTRNRFDFRKSLTRVGISVRLDQEKMELMTKIAIKSDTSVPIVALRLMEVGLEEYLKENPNFIEE